MSSSFEIEGRGGSLPVSEGEGQSPRVTGVWVTAALTDCLNTLSWTRHGPECGGCSPADLSGDQRHCGNHSSARRQCCDRGLPTASTVIRCPTVIGCLSAVLASETLVKAPSYAADWQTRRSRPYGAPGRIRTCGLVLSTATAVMAVPVRGPGSGR